MSNIVESLKKAIEPIEDMFDKREEGDDQRPSHEAIYDQLTVIAQDLDLELKERVMSNGEHIILHSADLRDERGNQPVFIIITDKNQNLHKFHFRSFGVLINVNHVLCLGNNTAARLGFPHAIQLRSIGAIIISDTPMPEIFLQTGEKSLNHICLYNVAPPYRLPEVSIYALYRK